MKNRIAPDLISDLKYNEVFVFGSNESGIHGGGAAYLAQAKFGAKPGVGFGLQGHSFALPTKSWGIRNTLSLKDIQFYVDRFVAHAKYDNRRIYLVTEVGCGIAGLTVKQVAPLFKKAMRVKNIHLPKRFWDVLIPAKDVEAKKIMRKLRTTVLRCGKDGNTQEFINNIKRLSKLMK